ncbi:hypothetical protein GCM10009001_03780 [Virgibacillus siamensis]|uniref:Holin-like toxin n=1 Tax=Virgibacillus siamensis TaxID=480071 RepID=A0ABN1FHM8_9BACI
METVLFLTTALINLTVAMINFVMVILNRREKQKDSRSEKRKS